MPYITQAEREIINPKLKEFLMFVGPMTPGQFVYVMYTMGLWQVSKGGVEDVPVGWTKCNEVMGNYDCVAKEFYRRIVGPYEDSAIVRNGDCNPPRANRAPYHKVGWYTEHKIDPFDTQRPSPDPSPNSAAFNRRSSQQADGAEEPFDWEGGNF